MSYTIQSGDTLWKIAQEQCGATGSDIQKTINEIAKLNNIANPDLIFTGNSLKLPGDTFQASATQTDAAQPAAQAAVTLDATGDAKGADTNGDFQQTNSKLFEEFESWRKSYAQAMQNYEDTQDQSALDAALSSIGGQSFDFNKDGSREENLKNIANGMFQSLSNEGGITYDAFLNWYKQGITASEQAILDEHEDRFKEAFEKIDTNGNIVLDADEVKDMFDAFDKMDSTIDGMISNKEITDPNRFTKDKF